MSFCASCLSLNRSDHVDSSEGRDAQHDRQGAEDEEGGAGSTGGPGLGRAERVSSWHDLH